MIDTAVSQTELGRRLRELRREAGLNLRAAAKAAEVSYGFLSDIEHGKRVPTVASLERILGVYGHQLAITPQQAGVPGLLNPTGRTSDE